MPVGASRLIEAVSVIGDFPHRPQPLPSGQEYLTLLAVSEAIVTHRDLSTLFHDLAGRLHHVVRFDFLALLLHDAANNTVRSHILETEERAPSLPFRLFPWKTIRRGGSWRPSEP